MDAMICRIFGPLLIDKKHLCDAPRVVIASDEFQVLIDMDLHHLTMQEWADKMGISKTVYAGLYRSARDKLVDALFHNKVIHLWCVQDDVVVKETQIYFQE